MSNKVDNRVVEMQFNNKQFERGIKTSLDSLANLKKGLDLSKSTDSLANLEKTAKGFSLGPLIDGVETISSKFSAIGIIGVTALVNIASQAVTAGEQIVKSLALDPIMSGFSEYELKMGSVQTIMAGSGESLETVMKYLEELNAYSDRTIYSFADMTTNIGKFTNTGLGLKESVEAIQGVANVAALAGANSEEA